MTLTELKNSDRLVVWQDVSQVTTATRNLGQADDDHDYGGGFPTHKQCCPRLKVAASQLRRVTTTSLRRFTVCEVASDTQMGESLQFVRPFLQRVV